MEKPLALTMGEPAGIGGDIALKAWSNRAQSVPTFFLIDCPKRLENLARLLNLKIPICPIKRPRDALKAFKTALPVLPLAIPSDIEPGKLDIRNSNLVIESIKAAVKTIDNEEAAAIVTNPIHKSSLYASGFSFPGHTEFLGALSESSLEPVMMLACDQLRVVPLTIHVPLAKVPSLITRDRIVSCAKIVANALKIEFSITRPRLAFTGLNPHAGECGTMGREESEIIVPALEQLRTENIQCIGPLAADSMFHNEARKNYDAAICMYHDQALVPIKTIAFQHAVNITLGLPYVRTSPDHGTALDIAGTGQADDTSLIAALKIAAVMAKRRAQWKQ